MARAHGLEVVERHCYYFSSYFTFLLLFHLLWRGWMIRFRDISLSRAAETFIYALRRPVVDTGSTNTDTLRG